MRAAELSPECFRLHPPGGACPFHLFAAVRACNPYPRKPLSTLHASVMATSRPAPDNASNSIGRSKMGPRTRENRHPCAAPRCPVAVTALVTKDQRVREG